MKNFRLFCEKKNAENLKGNDLDPGSFRSVSGIWIQLYFFHRGPKIRIRIKIQMDPKHWLKAELWDLELDPSAPQDIRILDPRGEKFKSKGPRPRKIFFKFKSEIFEERDKKILGISWIVNQILA